MAVSTTPVVRFVVTPFLPAHQPSLGVSSLHSVLAEAGIASDIKYLNISYLEAIGWDLYNYVAVGVPCPFLLGEVIFTTALWGDKALPWSRYESEIDRWQERLLASKAPTALESRNQWRARVDQLRSAYGESPAVVRQWAEEILKGQPRIIGFTSTFQQNIAALALAKEVRRLAPPNEVTIIFGGANCEAAMGETLAANFPFIDQVVSGEAESIIVDLVSRILNGPDRQIGGQPLPRFITGQMVHDMDALPLPNFDHYFEVIKGTEIEPQARLAVESSRGCWWGMKSHCTFCGLNGGAMMPYRSKHPQKFAAEIRALSSRYGPTFFGVTDNILDLKYIKTILPELIVQGDEFSFFYETKSNLSKEQLAVMAASGITGLQPGIESLSTAILKLMGKGTTRLQNIQLLKWAHEFGISLAWNLLYGFPREPPQDYLAMAELMPLLFHLPPPSDLSKVRLDRFAPYWATPEKYGIKNIRPYWAYDIAYSELDEKDRQRVAYYFEYDYEDDSDPRQYARPALDAAHAWQAAARRGVTLEVKEFDGQPCVIDTRDCRTEEVCRLTPTAQVLLKLLDAARDKRSLLRALENRPDQSAVITEAAVDAFIEDSKARGWVVEENGRLLSIVLDRAEYQRVLNLKVALRLQSLNINWPDDFPDDENREVVKVAVLSHWGNGLPR